jgi:hypothetical protein
LGHALLDLGGGRYVERAVWRGGIRLLPLGRLFRDGRDIYPALVDELANAPGGPVQNAFDAITKVLPWERFCSTVTEAEALRRPRSQPLSVQVSQKTPNAQTIGSAGCAALTQAGANGAAGRIAADDIDIASPLTVKSLTCLDKFFHGTGLDVVANLLDPTQLFTSIEGQLCNAITQSWQKFLGHQQCGITLTGFKIGFFNGLNLGGGLSCPKLTFGGGGPPIGTIGIGNNNNNGTFYFTGNARPPTGYTLPTTSGLW